MRYVSLELSLLRLSQLIDNHLQLAPQEAIAQYGECQSIPVDGYLADINNDLSWKRSHASNNRMA